MAKIFVSYRRDDSEQITRRMCDWLYRHFGMGSVFIDVDDIAGAADFSICIKDAIEKSRVLIAVVGPNWPFIRPKTGTRRIDEPDDPVRIELEIGISKCIPIFPVLVNGASMLRKEDLPISLASLCSLNARELLGDPHFSTSMEKLIEELKPLMKLSHE